MAMSHLKSSFKSPYTSPVLIVGGGLAGLFTALKLAPLPCMVLTPRTLGEGTSSSWAQGGIAAALDEGDTPEKHAHDTVAAGCGIVDESIALHMAQEARERVMDLLHFGVPFDRDKIGHFLQSKEAAHSAHRIVRVSGDKAGRAIMEALIRQARLTPSITIVEGFIAEQAIVENGQAKGVWARQSATGELFSFLAGATVLASGGIGALYKITTNPLDAQGLGLALAARAGAIITDPEFVQFHPTAIDIGLDPAPLATEALRGEGALLVDDTGHRFMREIHTDAELAPRDIVARGVFATLQAGRGAFLDARAALGAHFAEKFPTVFAACQKAGLDPATQLIPIAPAAHYHMGGVWTNERGATSLPRLYAAGEVACTGVHGANRLASNSLLEAIVFGARIAQDLKDLKTQAPDLSQASADHTNPNNALFEEDAAIIAQLRAIMQHDVGVIRSGEGLKNAVNMLTQLQTQAQSAHAKNMILTAQFIACGALARVESRGAHERVDYPHIDQNWQKHTSLTMKDVNFSD